MKNTIILVVLAMCFTACASNETAPTEGDTSASNNAPPGKKEVCKYERNSGGISRMKRVCKYVDAI